MRVYSIVGSAAMLALVLAGGVQAQGRGHERGNRGHGQPPEQARHGQPPEQARHGQPPEQARHARPPESAADQQRRIAEQRARDGEYRATLNRQMAAAQQRAAQLQAERRAQQYRAQQEYLERLRAQQRVVDGRHEYDRRIYAPPAYRYRRGGVYYQTSQYGADLLRQAVRYGYVEGYRAGQADRADGRHFDYRDNFAYLDGNYGYTGLYVPAGDYNFYFREGFVRGYQDGYYVRHQYGLLSGGAPAILAGVLAGILGLAAIR